MPTWPRKTTRCLRTRGSRVHLVYACFALTRRPNAISTGTACQGNALLTPSPMANAIIRTLQEPYSRSTYPFPSGLIEVSITGGWGRGYEGNHTRGRPGARGIQEKE